VAKEANVFIVQGRGQETRHLAEKNMEDGKKEERGGNSSRSGMGARGGEKPKIIGLRGAAKGGGESNRSTDRNRTQAKNKGLLFWCRSWGGKTIHRRLSQGTGK